MDQASASSAASCAHSPVAPRTSSSCSRSADRSQTGVPLPARSGPQSEPHAAPSNKHPSPSPPPSTDSRLRAISCRSFSAAQPHNPAASLRDYCSGAYTHDFRFRLLHDQLLVLDAITEGHDTSDPQPFLLRGGDLVPDTLARNFAFKLGEGEQYIQRETPHRARCVEGLSDRHEGDLVVIE